MRASLRAAACWHLLGAARGHGAMYEPPSRSSLGMTLMAPGCAGGACFWYTLGTSIGCTKSGGPPTNPGVPGTCMMQGHDPCCSDTLAEPTIGDDPKLRTFNLDGNNSGYPCNCCGGYCGGTCPPGTNSTWGPCGDWTRTNPWRKPGSAHVLDPCGMAGGSLPQPGQP
eukprot:gene15271-3136_t